MPDALYYRQQAERFARVADQCSIAELVPYYERLALDCLAHAVRAEATPAKAAGQKCSRRKRAAQR